MSHRKSFMAAQLRALSHNELAKLAAHLAVELERIADDRTSEDAARADSALRNSGVEIVQWLSPSVLEELAQREAEAAEARARARRREQFPHRYEGVDP